MSPQEVSALLAKIKLYDNRDITREVIVLWADIFEPVQATVSLAYDAFLMHVREANTYTQPAHIITNIHRIQATQSHGKAIRQSDKADDFIPAPRPPRHLEVQMEDAGRKRDHARLAMLKAQYVAWANDYAETD